MAFLLGKRELMKKLQSMESSIGPQVIRPALAAGGEELLQDITGNIPPDKKELKRAFGITVGGDETEQNVKVGAGVGRAYKFQPVRSGKNKGGVGIGGGNIHWAILGTKKMPPFLDGVVSDAATGANIMGTVRATAAKRLNQLAAK